MTTPPPEITFRPLTAGDLPLFHSWLSRPHVAEWWDGQPTLAELEAEYAPVIAGAAPVQCFLALAGGELIGFIQSYTPAECHDDGWWLDEHDPGVRGIDQFLANAEQLGQGLGTAMVRAFVARLFVDPAVTRIQVDPSPDNRRAIRCYEKAGFRAVRELDTPDGRALLMYCDRSERAES
jgi:RimJ/RimL family protein N-acetyltransferase